MSVGQGALPAVTMAEAQAFVRIETGEEEAIVAGGRGVMAVVGNVLERGARLQSGGLDRVHAPSS